MKLHCERYTAPEHMPCRETVDEKAVSEDPDFHSQTCGEIDNREQVFVKKWFTLSRNDKPLRACFVCLPNRRPYFGEG